MLGAMHPNLYALGAIALWATLASLGVLLEHVPPFLLTGLSLVLGSVLALPAALQSLKKWRQWRQWGVAPTALALGVFTFFGYHFFLFVALRMAPSVEVNLVNYLWPLLMVVLAPLYLPGVALRPVHWLAAVLGFAGAALAILGGSGFGTNDLAVGGPSVDAAGVAAGATTSLGAGFSSAAGWGYALAGLSALIWANFSLQTRRAASRGKHVPTAAIGLFGLVAGLLSLLCHALMEQPVALSSRDWLLLALMGLGPLGAAFFLWDKALKAGDARQIGILSYLTPLGSTGLLIVVSGRPLTWSTALAAAMILGAAVLGARAR